MQPVSPPITQQAASGSPSVAGWILVAVTLLAVFAMAHHPTVSASDTGQAVRRIADLSRPSAIVHGALMALLLLTFYGLTEFASQRGDRRPLIRIGTIAYGAGIVVMLGAALVSGFVITDVAALTPHDTPVDLQINRQLLILCGILNQACANCAVVAMSAGIGLWSIDLLRDRGVLRAIGLVGLVVGVVPIAALLSGTIRLDVHGMGLVLLIESVWNLAIAAWLIRRGRRP